jgi:hypothetical protein
MKFVAAFLLASLAFSLGGCSSTPVVGPEGGEFSNPTPPAQPAGAVPANP